MSAAAVTIGALRVKQTLPFVKQIYSELLFNLVFKYFF